MDKPAYRITKIEHSRKLGKTKVVVYILFFGEINTEILINALSAINGVRVEIDTKKHENYSDLTPSSWGFGPPTYKLFLSSTKELEYIKGAWAAYGLTEETY